MIQRYMLIVLMQQFQNNKKEKIRLEKLRRVAKMAER